MDKDDEYRAQAANAQQMADKANSAYDKSVWLQIAQGWLSMIRKPRQTAQESYACLVMPSADKLNHEEFFFQCRTCGTAETVFVLSTAPRITA